MLSTTLVRSAHLWHVLSIVNCSSISFFPSESLGSFLYASKKSTLHCSCAISSSPTTTLPLFASSNLFFAFLAWEAKLACNKAFSLASGLGFGFPELALALVAVFFTLGAMNPKAQQVTRHVSRNMAAKVQDEIWDRLEISKSYQNSKKYWTQQNLWISKYSWIEYTFYGIWIKKQYQIFPLNVWNSQNKSH